MIRIRSSNDSDIPAILELFKSALGEEGGIPEEKFWRWKHNRNPFGESPTLLAYEGDQLIGLRTFLRWRFRYQDELIHAYRAVDTATHPNFRGRGIFKKLTLSLIELIESDEPSFIFNTPNAMSRAGYLKMGWQVFGKTPLVVQPRPIQLIMNRFRAGSAETDNLTWPETLREKWNAIEEDYRKLFYNHITTDISFSYLQWRYQDVPGFTYLVHNDNIGADSCILFYRMKVGRLRELRITDIFFNRPNSKLVKNCIVAVTRKHQPDVVTLLEDKAGLFKTVLPFGFMSAYRFGLPLTYRHVNSRQLTELMAAKNRLYLSAGTVELL